MIVEYSQYRISSAPHAAHPRLPVTLADFALRVSAGQAQATLFRLTGHPLAYASDSTTVTTSVPAYQYAKTNAIDMQRSFLS